MKELKKAIKRHIEKKQNIKKAWRARRDFEQKYLGYSRLYTKFRAF